MDSEQLRYKRSGHNAKLSTPRTSTVTQSHPPPKKNSRALTDAVRAGAPKHDDVQQAVGPQPVGAVHRRAGGLAGGKEAGDDGVGLAGLGGQYLLRGGLSLGVRLVG